MEQKQLEKILKSIWKLKIAVIGDFCLDAYWEIEDSASEISVETGLNTRPVHSQEYSPGGAGNVVANLINLGVAEVHAFGVFGNDLFADKLLQLLKKLKVNVSGIFIQEENWNTSVYLKPIQNDKELNRFDFGNFNSLNKQTADNLIRKIENSISELNAVILNQQLVKGIHNNYFRNVLTALIASNPEKIFVTDSRAYADEFSGTIRKINEYELMKLSGFDVNSDDVIEKKQVLNAAINLSKKWNRPLFVTCGETGTIICENEQIEEIPAIKITGRIDSVGAGDSFLAAAVSALAAGANISQAAELGNLAAGVTVQKLLCTGTASPEEIIKLNNTKD